MLTVASEKPAAGRDEAAVTLRVQLSREQLTAALYNMTEPVAENLATAALVRTEIACALMSGSGTPDDLAHTGQYTRRAYAAGQLDADDSAWWALCWRRAGEVFFGEESPRPVRADGVPDLSSTPLAVAFGAAVAVSA